MSEFTIDRLVTDLAGVLSAMTESEKVLLDRIRRLRLTPYDERRVSSGLPSSRAAATPGAAVTSRAAAAPGAAVSAPPSWQPQAEGATQTYPRTLEPVATGHRDYNYFAELDEKLTGLRQRYLE